VAGSDRKAKRHVTWVAAAAPGPKGLVGLAALFFTLLGLMCSGESLAANETRLAVLPFVVNAPKPLEHLRMRLQEMLAREMQKKGFSVVDLEAVNRHPQALTPPADPQGLTEMALALKADYLAVGSLTQVGETFSLDARLIDANARKPPFLAFSVADHSEALSESMGQIASSFENQIIGLAQVDSVRVGGNQRIEREAILAVVKTKKGDRLDYGQLDKDLRDIYRMGYFTDVSIETEGGSAGTIVSFNVKEKPSIGKLVFEGNKKIEADDLKNEVGIKLYTILDQNEIKQSINRLKEFYRKKGYYGVEIKERTEPQPNNQVSVVYVIDEGQKIFITKIEFLGNKAFDGKQLKSIMETSEHGFLSWITDSGVLDSKKLEFDVFKLTSFYHNQGYIKAVVGDPKIAPNQEKGLTVTFEVKEGDRYSVGKVEVSGDLIMPSDELLKKVSISKEKVFNREVVRKDILALKEVFAEEGYAYAEVSLRTKENDPAHTVDIHYDVSKGEKVRFERINITGNTSTRDKVIRRELKALEGEYFNGKAVSRSTQNLNRLGFFETVEIQTRKGSLEDLMVMDVKVKEKPTGSFSFGAGYSSVDSVVGMVQIEQNNFQGYGQRLSASIRLGGNSSQFDVRFLEPWLLDRPISTEVRGYNWNREFDDYSKDSWGGSLFFGFPVGLDDYTKGSVQYGYEDSYISDVDDNASFLLRDMEGHSVTSAVTLGLTRNSVNRAWNPSQGSINSITFEYAGGIFAGDNYFNKYVGRSAWFFPLPLSTVFMTQGRWGYADRRSGGELPVYEKFFLGGLNTVRGYEYASISPRDPETDDKVGGEKMMCYNVEFRFPLIKEQGVIGLVFFDAGNVWESDRQADFADLRKSVGGGVRWYSPMGPLRLEWGYALDPRDDEESSQLEFSIGAEF
jgi:outer membrane protein insertion porin family